MNRFWLSAALMLSLAACQQAPDAAAGSNDSAIDSAAVPVMADGGLQIVDLLAGDGAEAGKGNSVVVHYTGWLYDEAAEDNRGSKFDSSVDRGQPFEFPLGAGRVIRGWDEGFAGMRVGGKRVLVIPPDMAYGERGAPPVIPPGATLVFEVELLDVR